MTDHRRAPLRAPRPEALPAVGPGARRLLDLIARAEGTAAGPAASHGFASGYDVPFNYGRSGPGLAKPLSVMTLDEVRAHQRGMRGSSAVGRYQIVAATLADLVARHGLVDDQRFDGTLQDGLARSLLRRRGYDDHLAGRLEAETLLDGLAAEWASLPMADGCSRYAFDDRPQPVGVSRAEARAVLAQARRLELGTAQVTPP